MLKRSSIILLCSFILLAGNTGLAQSDMDLNKKLAIQWIDNHQSSLDDAATAIWEFAELALLEYQSADCLADLLEQEGFTLERGVAEMPTAFVATYGSGKPVIGINAMAMRDTLVHGETALLANVSTEVWVKEAIVGEDQGYDSPRRIVFDNPRAADYRASVYDIAEHLLTLMKDRALREKMGAAGRARVCRYYDFRVVAKQFIKLVDEHLGVS